MYLYICINLRSCLYCWRLIVFFINEEDLMSDTDKTPVKKRVDSRKELIRAMRTVLQAIPFGIGSALDMQIFDRIAEREKERTEEFINSLSEKINQVLSEFPHFIKKELIDTDEFRYFLKNILLQVVKEHRVEKIKCFQAILINSMNQDPKIQFDRKVFFLEILDTLTIDHLKVLKYLYNLRNKYKKNELIFVNDIWNVFNAKDEATKYYLYSGLDTMANRQLLNVGPIPFKEMNVTGNKEDSAINEFDYRAINKPQQSYSISGLGVEFIEFVTLANVSELID